VAALFRWSVRLFALLAMLLFATLMVIFAIVTVDQFGQKQYVSDSVAGLPPVYVLTGVLVPFCAAFVAGFWMLFLDSFKDGPDEAGDVPLGPPPEGRAGLRGRIASWGRAHGPRWPGRAH
jgi:hypothetical protein